MTEDIPERRQRDDFGAGIAAPEQTESGLNGANGAGLVGGRTALLEIEERAAAEPVSVAVGEATGDRLRLTWEGLAYLLLIGAAALTRFWDLGSRALHHDESLHTFYSWKFATGAGYVHNPLMHGPFLFHANALVYVLFGDSDATSRYMPALFGTVLVGLPWLLRGAHFLGRFGALATSVLFLISPGFLYYSRYIRHDIYTVVGSLLLFTCLVRYLERPERRWLVGAAASLSFLFANHEIVFAIVAIFAGFLWGALLLGRLQPLLPLQIGAAVLAGAVVIGLPRLIEEPLPAIPWQSPTRQAERAYYRDLLTHPLVLTLVALAVAFLLACWWVIRDERKRRGVGLLDGAPAGSVEAAVVAAGRDQTGLWAAFGVFLAIFATLFTSVFTNIDGLATGTISTDGTLLYWLGQQGVQRGSQPWFYFIYILPQYELFVLSFGVAASVLTLWRLCLHRFGSGRDDPRLRFRLWLVVWFGAIFLGLSYAGEKMPWLVVHIALPGTLLAGSLLGELAERWLAAMQSGRAAARQRGRTVRGAAWVGPGLAALLLVLAGGWWFLAADLSYGEFVRPGGGSWRRIIPESALDRWWQLVLAPVAALAAVGLVWAMRGRAVAGQWAAVALVVGLAFLQVHQAWRLSFLEGDTPRDSLIYNTTSPDVTRMVYELGLLSEELTGGKDLVIWYTSGNGVHWPLNWYLRDFPNATAKSPSLSEPPEGVDVIIVANGQRSQMEPYLEGYSATGYVLRWHEPEYEIYRDFAIAPELEPGQSAWKDANDAHGVTAVIGSVGDSLATQGTPEGQARFWRIVFFRELPSPTMHFDYTVYVRNDLVPVLNAIRY